MCVCICVRVGAYLLSHELEAGGALKAHGGMPVGVVGKGSLGHDGATSLSRARILSLSFSLVRVLSLVWVWV